MSDKAEAEAEAARRWAIEPGFHDVQGTWREASESTLERVVEALEKTGSPAEMPEASNSAEEAFQGDGRREWVLAVQLYGVRSARNWGHGDFTDLANLLEALAPLGCAGVALNPLHAQFFDRPDTTGSPYAPNSRLFFNTLCIDIEAIEEFRPSHAKKHQAEISRLRDAELVDYPAVAKVKLAALRAVHRDFRAKASEQRRGDFEAYRSERGRELSCFAVFETLRHRFGGEGWLAWPAEFRSPTDELLRSVRDAEPEEVEFHEFLQWTCERQLAQCRDVAKRHNMPIGLYLDTAIGVDAGGADAWMGQGAMLQGLSIGAPPDQFNTAGQDWGITTYNPHGLVKANFKPFRQMLRAAMHYAGAMRLDHVLGLMRLYVIPHGLGAAHGVYIRLPFTALLSIVAEESRRWNCIFIGEDLGTVPEGFRETTSRWGVWSYRVVMFERNDDGSFKRPQEYPERAIATFNTHDLSTFAGWMSGHDLRLKREIGIDPGESDQDRENSRNALKHVLGRERPSFDDIVEFLAATPSRLVAIAIEDVLGLEDQPNIPSTVAEHPNWKRRWPVLLEEFKNDQRLIRMAATLASSGRASSTAP